MKWFKHYANASESVVLSTIVDKLGNEGYGIYWRIMELLCSNYDGDSTHFEFTLRCFKRAIGVRTEHKLSIIAVSMEYNDSIALKFTSSMVIIDAPILSKLKDRDYKKARKVRANSALEENRIDKTIVKAAAKKAPGLSDALVKIWNEMAEKNGLAKVKTISAARRKRINICLEVLPDLKDWRDLINKIPRNDFLMGGNDRRWKANFDYLINTKEPFLKLHEENNLSGRDDEGLIKLFRGE